MIKLISILLLSVGVMFSFNAQNLDFTYLKKINSSYTETGGRIQSTFSNSVTPSMICIPAGILAYSLFKKDSVTRLKFYTIASSELVAGIFTTSLKFAVHRDRPFKTYPNDIFKHSTAGSLSFPSGHTSAAFSLATSLSLAFPKWYVIAPSLLWAGTVGYSRMYLGVHYPSDVLVGAIIGAGTSYLCYRANKWIRERRGTN
jgi:membrane-associated phospholipid phosphatase